MIIHSGGTRFCHNDNIPTNKTIQKKNFRQDSFHKKHKRKHKPHSKKKSSHSHFTEDELKSRRAKGSEVNNVKY